MKGTILSVTFAIFLIPPIITIPTKTAITKPNNHPLPCKNETPPTGVVIFSTN